MNTKRSNEIRQYGMTKVVCTLGPTSSTPTMIRKLIAAGMDVARINFSHGHQADHGKVMARLRREARRAGREVAVLADLQGPKIRTNEFVNGSMSVKTGTTVTLTYSSHPGGDGVITTSFKPIVDAVKPGDRILIDDGLIELRVTRKQAGAVQCLVLNGGVIKDHKGINIPEAKLNIPSLTEKDILDAKFALKAGVDFIALSFVRSAKDLQVLRDLVRRSGRRHVGLVAKIEKPEALNDLDNIIREADAIMVARGDLGVEVGSEKVPVLQKTIISRCLALEVPVITATQMLDSMIRNPRPTRAEASDVANAIFDGSDAVMLSGETAAGDYPVEAVRTMRNIIRDAEGHDDMAHFHVWQHCGTAERGALGFSIGREACDLATSIKAVALACLSDSGGAAIRLTSQRPQIPVYVFSDRLVTVRKANLFRGALGILIQRLPNSDEAFIAMEKELLARRLIAKGDHVVYTAGLPSRGRGSTNTIHVRRAS